MTARLRPQNAKAVFRVMEGDPLDEASETSCVEGSGFDLTRTDTSFPAKCRERCGALPLRELDPRDGDRVNRLLGGLSRERIQVFALRTDGRFFVSSPFRRFRHSADRAVASHSAAALAASKVSAVPAATRSPPLLALRRTSHFGTFSSEKTNSMKPPTSVETAGLGQSGGSGCQTTSVICSLLHATAASSQSGRRLL
jgi:hypothetical protein